MAITVVTWDDNDRFDAWCGICVSLGGSDSEAVRQVGDKSVASAATAAMLVFEVGVVLHRGAGMVASEWICQSELRVVGTAAGSPASVPVSASQCPQPPW